MTQTQPVRQLLASAPHFFVASVQRAAAYYRDVLGFAFDRFWGDPPHFCMPHRDGLVVMLAQPEEASRVQPNGADGCSWDAYFWVHDAEDLFAEFKAKGAQIVYDPEERDYYGNREFAIRDIDGYILAFAHSIEAKRRRTG